MEDNTAKELLRLTKSIANSLETVNLRLDGFETRFSSIDKRFNGIEQRLASIDLRFDNIEHRLSKIEQRLANIEKWIPVDNSNLV